MSCIYKNPDYQKIYRDTHKENKKGYMEEYNKSYYEKMKSGLVTVQCDCGGHYSIYTKARHVKSKKHLKFFENI